MCQFLSGELEKCLEELETEHSQTLQLANVFDKVETERDQLLNELDLAFLDLQEYMHRQVSSFLTLRLLLFCYSISGQEVLCFKSVYEFYMNIKDVLWSFHLSFFTELQQIKICILG